MKRREQGFTIVEFLIYMLIFSMLILILAQMFGSILNVMLESQSKSGVLRNGEFILARLSYDIKSAEKVKIPENIGQSSSTMKLLINGEDYTYSLNGSDLVLTNNSGSNKLSSFDADVGNINFRNLGYENGKSMVEVTISFESKDFKTTVGVR